MRQLSRCHPALVNKVFRGAVAVRAGWATRSGLRAGCYRRLLRDVYCDAAIEVTHAVRCSAAGLLMPPSAAIGGLSALCLRGCTLAEATTPVMVVVPPGVSFGPVSGVRISRAELPARDIVRLPPGDLPVTTVLRAAQDIAAGADLVEAVVVLDNLLHDRLVDKETLLDFVAARRGTYGSRRAERAVRLADPRAESPPETRLRLLLISVGLPPTALQFEVVDGGRFVARVDLAYEAARLAVEYDGAWHGLPGELHRDRQRSRGLAAAGWRVVGVTAADLRNPHEIIEQISRILGRRARWSDERAIAWRTGVGWARAITRTSSGLWLPADR